MQPTRIKTSAGMETVDETVSRVKSAINTVPVETLENPPSSLDLPQVEFDPTTATSAVEAAQGFSEQQQSNLQQQQEAEKTQTGAVRNLMDFVAGRGAERVETLEDAGIPDSTKELADLTSDIRLATSRLTDFDDATFLGEEQLRQEGAGRDITKRTFSAQANQRRLQRAIDRTGRASALRTQIATAELMQNNITAATAQIDAALEAKYAPVEQALQNEMFFLQRQFQLSDRADSRAFEARMGVVQAQQAEITDAKSAVQTALQFGATPAEVQQMNAPGITPKEQIRQAQGIIARGASIDRALAQQAKQASIAASAASRRKNLVDLALTGDSAAIQELGFDPGAGQRTQEALANLQKNEDAVYRLTQDMTKVSGMLANGKGLEMSSGAITSPALSAIFNPAGGIATYPALRDSQSKFLTDANYIVQNLTFDKLASITENTSLGAISEGELKLVGAASDELAAAARYDDGGNLTHFNLGEDDLRGYIADINTNYQRAMDKYNAELGLDASERLEIYETQ